MHSVYMMLEAVQRMASVRSRVQCINIVQYRGIACCTCDNGVPLEYMPVSKTACSYARCCVQVRLKRVRA